MPRTASARDLMTRIRVFVVQDAVERSKDVGEVALCLCCCSAVDAVVVTKLGGAEEGVRAL